ncbi:hypothetical protein ABFS82_02G105000 [Erythranthe guttata]|uniref:23 kDa thylakoid membrane protein n=1 Tax=Erythranthe guttata TaxID=4155 RepID=A0A022QDX6_ERYGU|nr:PREDICTED: uncharacterized protein LOC105969749 [Erythranthe guttata]EYU26892.1 hypothetical protein MIMGU_mgv1a012366mg [Erythranthe guttata]|eukprot:XP_012849980.1 PREDICTED: uncharacterized protein LOC105969749 [Erythranthe guttata]
MAMSRIVLSLSPTPPPPPTTIPESHPHPSFFDSFFTFSRRSFILTSSVLSLSSSSSSLAQTPPPPKSPPPPSSSSAKSFLSGIGSTKSWFQFYGSGFAIRVPPNFEDIMEPEDYNAGLSLYGDKAKPKTFAARFASPDGSEVLSVVVRPSNQLKITFLEAKDIADLGSLKEASRIFVPVGVTLYSARIIKIKEEDGYRNYYFYEFGADEQRVALVAAVNSGKVIIAGVTAPQNKWDDHGVRLRSAAVSLTLV